MKYIEPVMEILQFEKVYVITTSLKVDPDNGFDKDTDNFGDL